VVRRRLRGGDAAAVQRRRPLVAARVARGGQRLVHDVCRPRLLPTRCQGDRLQHRVLQCQAPRLRAVLPARHPGPRREPLRRVSDLPPHRAGPRPGQPVLVGDHVRPNHPRPHPGSTLVKSVLQHTQPAAEPRRHRRPLLRPRGTRGQRVQLDPTRADGEFELMFRFYGPEKPLFDKTWQVADVDRID
jgi:hypothetical protein